ncbi:MAG: HNH endonuclease signature motif containing protein [Vicinamibacterales bacterium]
MQDLESLKHLTDRELLEHADGSALGESQSKARLVASLAEIDRRRLYLDLGYTSLYAFCTERLHLSEHEALNRIEAARAAVVFPVILERLALPKSRGAETPPPAQEQTSDSGFDFQPSAVASPLSPLRRPVVAPLSEERYRVQVTFGRMAHEKLRRAQALLRHQLPSGDLATVLERALDALLVDLMKTKAGAVARPRDSRTTSEVSRHIPASVNHRCSETGLLEYHHVVPFASGGKTTVENIELRCRPHNGYEAELEEGLEEFTRSSRRR